MKLKNKIQNRDVYFDANIFIYLLEGNKDYTKLLGDIQTLIENNDIRVFSSDLVYAELLPPHAKQGNKESMEQTINFLNKFNMITASKEIFIHAGILRGETNMKTPDAIHVATAMASGCEIFLTNDRNIRGTKHIEVVLLIDYLDP